jgi:general secretion pathway protein D
MVTLTRSLCRSFAALLVTIACVVSPVSGSTTGLAVGALTALSSILGIDAEYGASAATLIVHFSGDPPGYHVLGDGSPNVRVVFRGVTVARSIPPLRPAQAFRFGFSSFGTSDAILTVISAAPLKVRASISGSALIITCAPQGSMTSTAARAPAVPFAAPTRPGAARRAAKFRLQYADVSEIAGMLVPGSAVVPNDVFVPQTSNLGQPGSMLGSGGGVAPPPTTANYAGDNRAFLSIGERISDTIAIDRRMNAIIVIGTPEEIATVQSVIDLVDVPIPTVLLEVEIVELTDSAARDVGIDFSAGGNAGNGSLVARTLSVTDSVLTLQAAIYAQVIRGEGKIVAKPRVSTLDGKTASILTGDAIPIITNLSFPTSGSPVVQQQVQYVNVGVNVQLRPQVGDDNVVTSHVFAEVSSVTGYVNGTIPRISQRQASTIATVRDGQTLILGGLIQQNELKTLQRTPFLSDLPLLGNLFNLVHTTAQNTNLYMLITPHITRPERAGTKQATVQ